MKFIAVTEDNIKGIFIYIHEIFIKIMIDPIRYPDKSNPKYCIQHLGGVWLKGYFHIRMALLDRKF